MPLKDVQKDMTAYLGAYFPLTFRKDMIKIEVSVEGKGLNAV
jgi:hypothetical protein